MPISLACHCGHTFEVADARLGHHATCPACGVTITSAPAAAAPSGVKSRRRLYCLLAILVISSVADAIVWSFVLMEIDLQDWIPDRQAAQKKGSAAAQIRILAISCDAYKLKHNKYPETLQTLLTKYEFGIIYINDPTLLIDPWGRPIQYDPSGPNNQGLKPEIWFLDEKRKEIGNWPKQK